MTRILLHATNVAGAAPEALPDLGVSGAGLPPPQHPPFEGPKTALSRHEREVLTRQLGQGDQSVNAGRAPPEPASDLAVVMTLGNQAEDSSFDGTPVQSVGSTHGATYTSPPTAAAPKGWLVFNRRGATCLGSDAPATIATTPAIAIIQSPTP